MLHTAWRGQGAWRDGERIRVSPVDALDRALVVHSSINFLRKSRYWEGFLRLADRTQVQRGFGDFSAYLWVAEGQGEIAFSTTVKAWDVAALKVLVEEAGGRLTDLDGGDGIYGTTVFASNGVLHDAALAAMHDGQPHPERLLEFAGFRLRRSPHLSSHRRARVELP